MSRKGWLEYIVTEADEGMNVEQVVRQRMNVSGRMLQRLTRRRGLLLNQRPPYLQRPVKAGDKVAVRVSDAPKPAGKERQGRVSDEAGTTRSKSDGIPQPLSRLPDKTGEAGAEIPILYEDDHLLAVDKPAGMMVYPLKAGQQGTLVQVLAEVLQRRGETGSIHAVHRLDKDTSGTILLAKSSYGHQLADRLLREGKIRREYLAVVSGRLEQDKGTIYAPIGRDPHHPTRRCVTERGDVAITHYEVEARSSEMSRVRVWLETGRTHQIRVHFCHLGHPLVGDVLYGGRRGLMRRQALHAQLLSFPHPLTGQEICCTAPLPADLRRLIHAEFGTVEKQD